MDKFNKVKANLEKNGFKVSVFADAKSAADYLDSEIDGKTVGFGGSVTLRDMGVWERLCRHNTVYDHMHCFPSGTEGELLPPAQPDPTNPGFREAALAQVYLTSANALVETGEIINIDGYGNRVGGSLFGHEKVYFVIGRNKLAPTYDEAVWRARNIAAPKNAQRKKLNTPCAAKADKCYNCNHPQRICRVLTVIWQAIEGTNNEVILIDEDLGF